MFTFWMKASSLDLTSAPAPAKGDGGEALGFPAAPFSRGNGSGGGAFGSGEPAPPPPPELDFITFHESLPINCFHMAARSGGTNTTSNLPN